MKDILQFVLFDDNPFNNMLCQIMIKKSTSQTGIVTLKVFDVLGNEIASLFNEEKSTGNYEFTFDAAGLPSGIYFYKLQTGSFTETKKMILLR